MERPDPGLSGAGGKGRIHQELRRIQEDRSKAAVREGGKETEEKAETQAISKSGISGAKSADRRQICAILLCDKWREILPVYRSGRMQPLDIQGDV